MNRKRVASAVLALAALLTIVPVAGADAASTRWCWGLC